MPGWHIQRRTNILYFRPNCKGKNATGDSSDMVAKQLKIRHTYAKKKHSYAEMYKQKCDDANILPDGNKHTT